MYIKTISNLSKFLGLSERQTKRIIQSGNLPKESKKGWATKTVAEFKSLYKLKKSDLIALIIENKGLKNKSHEELRELRKLEEDMVLINIDKIELA